MSGRLSKCADVCISSEYPVKWSLLWSQRDLPFWSAGVIKNGSLASGHRIINARMFCTQWKQCRISISILKINLVFYYCVFNSNIQSFTHCIPGLCCQTDCDPQGESCLLCLVTYSPTTEQHMSQEVLAALNTQLSVG